VLAEDLAALLGKTLVKRRAFAAWAKPFLGAVSLVHALQQIKVVTGSSSFNG
jgi:hypothetical protein